MGPLRQLKVVSTSAFVTSTLGFYGWHTLSWRQQLHASLIIVEELETRGPSAVGATEYTLAEVSETDYTNLGSCGFL